MDVRSRHRTSPRSTRFVLGKASDIDDGLKVIMWIRCLGGERLPTASYALRPNLNKLFFASEKRDGDFLSFVFYTPADDTPSISIHNAPTVDALRVGKASENRWRIPKIHVDPWSRGREVARDVLRSLPKAERSLSFAIGDGSRFFIVCFLLTSGQMSFLRRLAGTRHVSPAFV